MNAIATPNNKVARDPRNGLRTSATLATVFTIFGHAVFGFEQSVAHVLVALGSGYACALFFEYVDARVNGRLPGFAGGGPLHAIDFLASAHMTAITTSFLIYTNTQFWILAFIVAVAIGSKYFFRVELRGKARHFMNPSNLGMVVALVFYQWTAVIPWGLTTELHGALPWLLTALVFFLGLRLNLLYTGKFPLIASFFCGFVIQAAVRSLLLGNPLTAELALLTNTPMALFMLYMITDPQTSPSETRGQVFFGLAIAGCYGLLLAARINFALFICVTIVTAARGCLLYLDSLRERGSIRVAGAAGALADSTVAARAGTVRPPIAR
jgi:enediyne biosynthesis protein E5